jgi:hypothetical protein
MDVLTIILACSVYPDEHLVRAMVDLASQGNAYFVGDLTTLLTFDQNRSAADAQRVVSEIDRRGGRPAVGLMGLPPSWASRPVELPGTAGPLLASADLFDACTNIRVGTTVLRAHYEACQQTHSLAIPATPVDPARARTAPPEALRLCALHRYASDLGVEGFGESVLQYLPRQRVFGSANVFGPASAAGSPANACLCEPAAAPRPRRRPTVPREREPGRAKDAQTTTAADTGPVRVINPGGAPILE